MADEDKKDEKKIIADEDWKDQARKEKEVLTEQEKLEHEEPQEEPKRPESLPKGDFAGLISMLVTQALFALGVLEVPGHEEKREPDLQLAKYNIDLLETLEDKTKGNLSEEEENVLTNTLSQVRMAYVKIAG